MWPVWFVPWPGAPVPPVQPTWHRPAPDACARVLARTRHPSFTPELAAELVGALPRRRLRELWAATSALLDTPLPVAERLAYVILRQELLLALERIDPAGYIACYAVAADRAR